MSDYQYNRRETPFRPSARTYNANNALLMACAANLAYDPEDVIESVVKKWGFSQFKFFDSKKKGTQAFVCGNSKAILISFRGTEPSKLEDLKADADLRKETGVVGKVHRGFKGALTGVWPSLLEYVKSIRTQEQKIWVTGHSLGAALATLAAARLQIQSEIPVRGLITFGQPRTGNKEFAERFDAAMQGNAYRFVNNTDIVTRLPPPSEFQHIGRMIYFKRNGIATNKLSNLERKLDTLKANIKDLSKPGLKSVKDHSMDMYVRRVRKNLDVDLIW